MTRNEKILRLFLYGSPYTDIAPKFGITQARARQIVCKEIYKLRALIHIQDTGNKLNSYNDAKSYSVKQLRGMKNRILTILENKQ